MKELGWWGGVVVTVWELVHLVGVVSLEEVVSAVLVVVPWAQAFQVVKGVVVMALVAMVLAVGGGLALAALATAAEEDLEEVLLGMVAG